MIDKILDKIKCCIRDNLKDTIKINISENKSAYDSIIASAGQTPYRSDGSPSILVGRVKLSGKIHYVSFSKDFIELFRRAEIEISKPASDGYCRMDIDEFLNIPSEKISPVITEIILKYFNYPSFDCCSRFDKCTAGGKCLHPDYLYASAACSYKRKLEKGIVFGNK